MKFLADFMLGKLAKWMRILSLDVVYAGNLGEIEENRIAEICLKEVRMKERLYQLIGGKDALE